jgi:4-carboxymuconolactone decarboxylase
MTTRKELRRQGATMRNRLFGAEQDSGIAPGFDDLMAEIAYGAVWNRPGLSLSDRMIATLAALCSVQRLPQLSDHIAAAINLDVDTGSIIEVFIQCGIYAGFPASENAISVAADVFAEHGIDLPEEAPRDDPLDELMQRGRTLLEKLHGSRGYTGYASPDNRVTGALYPLAIQYGYGEIWDRPGLDFRQRALVAVAAFTALRLEGQVKKFGQSALNAGLSRDEIVETVIQTGPYSGLAPALNALAALSDVLS